MTNTQYNVFSDTMYIKACIAVLTHLHHSDKGNNSEI